MIPIETARRLSEEENIMSSKKLQKKVNKAMKIIDKEILAATKLNKFCCESEIFYKGKTKKKEKEAETIAQYVKKLYQVQEYKVTANVTKKTNYLFVGDSRIIGYKITINLNWSKKEEEKYKIVKMGW